MLDAVRFAPVKLWAWRRVIGMSLYLIPYVRTRSSLPQPWSWFLIERAERIENRRNTFPRPNPCIATYGLAALSDSRAIPR